MLNAIRGNRKEKETSMLDGAFNEELFLTNKTGSMLYHKYAEHLPIIDYHCHLQPRDIAENREFEDIGEMWLSGDHYKWRAMRTFGIPESHVTGVASYKEKYLAFAGILPRLIGNPIWIWCALELKRFFDIDEPLRADNAEKIYEQTKAMIMEKHITPRWCMEKCGVKLVSTTEDPIDELKWHKMINEEADPAFGTRVITAFRPDQAMFIANGSFPEYIKKLEKASGVSVRSYQDMLRALEDRLVYFKEVTGTTVSDDGIPYFKAVECLPEEAERIFRKGLEGKELTREEIDKYQSAFLYNMAKLYKKHDYVMQLHIGTYLDANSKKVREIGKSTGFDCTDDATMVKSVGELLNVLTEEGELPKTILYPLDGTKIENWAILAAGFCDGVIRGKVQLGAPWWFNDQAFGIRRQFESCANLYPLSLSVGMLTDSRSFLSYPRHEVYRRILCDYLGSLVERGEYFGSEKDIAGVIRDICIKNVNEFFGFGVEI